MGITEWSEERLSNLADVVPGGTPPTSDKENWNGDTLWATPTDITATSSKYISETARKITKKGTSYASPLLPVGSILLCTRATIGESKIASKPITTNQGFKSLVVKENVSNEWLYYVLKTKIEKMKSLSSGSTFLELGTRQLKELQIATPKYLEQIVIAEVLGDIDELISITKNAISKTENTKQSILYPLLTGKASNSNLAKWQHQPLGEILEYEQPTKYLVNTNKHKDFGKYPVLTAGKSFILGYTDDDYGVYTREETILFDDFTTGNKYVDFPFKVKSSACKMLTPRTDAINLRFVFEAMKHLKFQPYDHKRYWISEYSKLVLPLPEKNEQDSIAEVINDFDLKLSLLELELEKYVWLKQGMMNDLLTGKVRLV